MTTEKQDFDLHTLWQSEEGQIDMDMIMDTRDRLERGRSFGRKMYTYGLGIYAVIAAMVCVAEWAGLLLTNWIVPAGYIALGLFILAVIVRGRRDTPVIAELSAKELLENAIDRARNNLLIGRTLYAAYPGGVLFGMGVTPFIVGTNFDLDKLSGAPVWALLGYIGVALLSVPVSIYFGVRLATRKQAELKELRARLASLEGVGF